MTQKPPMTSVCFWSMPFILAALATKVEAQDSYDSPWDFTLGIGVQSDPDYEGSDEQETMGIPAIEISYDDRLRFSTLEGVELSGDVFKTDVFTARIGILYNW